MVETAGPVVGHLREAGQGSVRVSWSSGLSFCMHHGNHY